MVLSGLTPPHHGRCHASSRMQTVHHDRHGIEFACEVERSGTIKHLQDTLTLADEIEDGETGYLMPFFVQSPKRRISDDNHSSLTRDVRIAIVD